MWSHQTRSDGFRNVQKFDCFPLQSRGENGPGELIALSETGALGECVQNRATYCFSFFKKRYTYISCMYFLCTEHFLPWQALTHSKKAAVSAGLTSTERWPVLNRTREESQHHINSSNDRQTQVQTRVQFGVETMDSQTYRYVCVALVMFVLHW